MIPARVDDLAASLKEAALRGDLKLVFQPKIEVASGELKGVEALTRWQHPVDGTIAPSLFIPSAERLGLIDWLTDWVLVEALRQWTVWNERGIDIDIAVNFSAQTFDRLDVPDLVGMRCEYYGVPPHRLIVELTEGSAQNAIRLLDSMGRFRLKGIKISLDDYGTGYSSLVQLQRLPFNEIKIDRCFVEGADRWSDTRAILKSSIDLAHSLGLTATAEGVETQSILDLLTELGCDQAQGYLIGRPMPGEELPNWLEARAAETSRCEAE